MDREIFLQKVIAQFVDLDKILSFESNFRENNSYDSLTGMTIMVMIKDDYGIDITENEYRSKKSIAELYDFVNQNKKQ